MMVIGYLRQLVVELRKHALLLILLLAAVMRLVAFNRSLWYDEAFAVLFAEKGLGPMLYGTLTPVSGGAADIHPLLYYVILGGWMKVFGEDPYTVRLLSVIFGVATIGVIYLLGRDLFDRRTGLAAALIASVAPFAIQYHTEVRMYSLLGLLLSAATWCFVRGWREPAPLLLGGPLRRWGHRWRWWVAFGVLAGLAMYTQQLAAFYLAALGAFPFLARKRRPLLGALLGAAIAVILYLPWLIQLPGQMAKIGAYYWTSAPNAARFVLTVYLFLVVNLDLPGTLGPLALVCAVFVFVFLVVQTIRVLRAPRREDRRALALVFWLFAGPVVLAWLVSQIRPVYLERGLLPSALLLYLALGWLFARGGLPKPILLPIVILAVIMFGSGFVTLASWKNLPNADYPAAANWLEWETEAEDRIVHQNKMSALPMIYYARDLPQGFIIDVPGSPEDTLAVPTQEMLGILGDASREAPAGGAGRRGLVNYDGRISEAKAAGRSDVLAEFDWLDTHYTLRESKSFAGGLTVALYDTPDAVARAARVCPSGS